MEAASRPRPICEAGAHGPIWGTQSALVALILLLLWQPAMMVSELSSQQNIIAVVVDDSRSMAHCRQRRQDPRGRGACGA